MSETPRAVQVLTQHEDRTENGQPQEPVPSREATEHPAGYPDRHGFDADPGPPICEDCLSEMVIPFPNWFDQPACSEGGPICPLCSPEELDAYFAWRDEE